MTNVLPRSGSLWSVRPTNIILATLVLEVLLLFCYLVPKLLHPVSVQSPEILYDAIPERSHPQWKSFSGLCQTSTPTPGTRG